MPNVKPVPDGYHTITPHIVVKDIRRAADFYKKAFGAEERFMMPGPDGKTLMHGEVKIGDSHLMLAAENPQWNSRGPVALGGTPVTIALYVNDCDKSYKRAIDAGATPGMPPSDMFWGDRWSMVKDPDGHCWSIATHTSDPTPAQMAEGMKKMCT
jgi:uncharacterized glyoxalase superfamily protein PhnB